MKIILSRKGFDSGIGKVASPIFPSGEMCSLPIPEFRSHDALRCYEELKCGNLSLGSVINDLTRGKIKPDTFAHLDPDLNFTCIPRQENWKPIFGQAGAAERHLQNCGVTEGDIFVFYGWFRQVEQVASSYRYVKDAPDLHVIFGWLQIEQRISMHNLAKVPRWALDHPHCNREKYSSIDSLYISTERLTLPNVAIDKPGAGVFRTFDPALCLTAPGRSRSIWRLPQWLHPGEGKSGLSYHMDISRWRHEGDSVYLKSAGRGQEFVLDCQEYPESIPWFTNMLDLVSPTHQMTRRDNSLTGEYSRASQAENSGSLEYPSAS